MTASDLTAARSGVYRAPGNVADLRDRVEAAGLVWIEVHLAQTRTKADLLTALAAACGFPTGFGANWDALADSLGDFSWRSARGYVLWLHGTATAQRALGVEWNTFVDVLSRAAREWQARGNPFVALIDGVTLPEWPRL